MFPILLFNSFGIFFLREQKKKKGKKMNRNRISSAPDLIIRSGAEAQQPGEFNDDSSLDGFFFFFVRCLMNIVVIK